MNAAAQPVWTAPAWATWALVTASLAACAAGAASGLRRRFARETGWALIFAGLTPIAGFWWACQTLWLLGVVDRGGYLALVTPWAALGFLGFWVTLPALLAWRLWRAHPPDPPPPDDTDA